MTDTAFDKFNAYLPYYGKNLDALRKPFHNSGLLSFPESTDSNQSGDLRHGLGRELKRLDDESKEILIKINKIMHTDDGTVESLESWIQMLDDKNIKVDINRVTHFAIKSNRHGLVKHLVEHKKAQLDQRDRNGRSAVFYAVTTKGSEMLQYVQSIVGAETVRKEMNYHDEFDATPMYYAAMAHSVSNVEFCLTAGARSEVELVEHEIADRWIFDVDRIHSSFNQIRLLLTLYGPLRSYGGIPIHIDKLKRSHKSLTIDQLHTNLTLPTDETCMNTWIHIPWTNGIMLFAAFRILQKRIKNRSTTNTEHCIDFFRQCFLDPSIIPRNPDLNYRIPIHEGVNGEPLFKAPCIAIVFPSLVLQNIETFKSSRAAHRTSRKLIEWTYAEKLIQVERTLDEAYYPSLHSNVLEKRNKDQVVSRECTSLLNGESVSDDAKPILTVPQLWIWKIGGHVLSAYSMPGKDPSVLRNVGIDTSSYQKKKATGVSRYLSVEDPDLHIGLLLADQIDNFGKTQANDSFPAPLDIFETGVVRVMSSVDEYMEPDTSETLEIKTERGFMHDISDIRSELVMIDEILLEQERIVTSLLTNSNRNLGEDELWHKVENAKKQLDTHRNRVKKIDRDAERIEKIIQDQLNLKRTFATIRDTRTSLLLGTAVIGFTIVTIIFTPIAFMATLFALPIDKIVRNQIKIRDTDAFETKYIGKWFVTAEITSLVVTGLAVWVSVWLLGGFNNTKDAKAKTPKPTTDSPAAGHEKKGSDDGEEFEEVEETKASHSKLKKSPNSPGFWKRPKKSEIMDV